MVGPDTYGDDAVFSLVAKDENVSREETEDDGDRSVVRRVQVVAILRHRLVDAIINIEEEFLLLASQLNVFMECSNELRRGVWRYCRQRVLLIADDRFAY